MEDRARGNGLFVLEQLIKRDFTKKYQRTALGFAWSVVYPLLLLLVMNFVYSFFFAKSTPHYTIYLFSGFIQYNYLSTATNGAMGVIHSNAGIFNKIKIGKIYFVISNGVSYLITYLANLLIYFAFVAFDGIPFSFRFLTLLFPVLYLILLTSSLGLLLAVLYVFFRDLKYIYPVFMRILLYVSAIFYSITAVPEEFKILFWINPLYLSIHYFRSVVIDGMIPGLDLHIYMLLYVGGLAAIAAAVYKKLDDKIYLHI